MLRRSAAAPARALAVTVILVLALAAAPKAVAATATQTTLTVTPSALVAYQDATLQATVTAAEGGGQNATGTVQFYADGGFIGAAYLAADGHAALRAGAPAGTYALTAAYSGDDNYTTSQSPPVTQTVATAGSVTTVDAAPNPAAFGAQIEWFIDVSALAPSAGLPTGDILISVDGDAPDRFALDAFAQADLAVAGLAGGAHTVTVSYPGDADFQPSAFTFTQTITGGPQPVPQPKPPAPVPQAPPKITPLTARGLLSAVRVPAAVRVPRSGVIGLGTAANPPLRSLTVEVRGAGAGASARATRARWTTAAAARPLLGRAKLTLAAGARRAVTVRLNAKARAQVRLRGRLRVAVRLTAVDRTGATVRATVNRTLTRARR